MSFIVPASHRAAFVMITVSLLAIGAQNTYAQTVSTSSLLVAQPIPDRTVWYNTKAAGVSKPIEWGLDCAWPNEANMKRGIAFMGLNNIDLVRASFQPTLPLINGDLQQSQINDLNYRLYLIGLTGPNTKVALNCDHPSVDPWYIGNASNWAQLIDATTKRVQDAGRTVVSVAPFNEPDYGWGQYTGSNGQSDFYNIAGALKIKTRFANIRISGGNTLNCDQALPWYNYLRDRLNEGNTHQLAGSFDAFASFYQTIRAAGHHATGDELHNVMEAMVGSQYGMQTGIWWGTAELARGEFVKASHGMRLGYAEHRSNWTAASVYKSPDGKLQAFGGTSERQAVTTRYRFVSKDKDVYYEGYGPLREYSMLLPGGNGYMNGQTNAERVVNISWGEDIQPAINGQYIIVNKNSGKVLEIANGSADRGVAVQQNTYSGAAWQKWNIVPVDSRIGGDFSYFTITSAYSGKAIDDLNWSLDNGGGIIVWDDVKGANQQRFLDYAGDGWFYIRSRHSAKCLDVYNSSTQDAAAIKQWDVNGAANQQWRLIPVGAAVEFNAPAAPVNLAAIASTESVKLTWNANAEQDLAGYTIFRADQAGGVYNTIARNITASSFVDNTAVSGTAYYYKIKAVDQSLNRSAYSNEVFASPTGNKDLIAYYTYTNNTVDSSQQLNHSATFGNVSFASGKSGQAISLNGSNAFIQLPATIANHNEMTIAAWVYWNGGNAWQRIFDFGNDITEYLFLTPSSSSGQMQFSILQNGVEQKLTAPAMAQNQWVHVAVSIGSNGLYLFVNGQPVAQNTNAAIRPADIQPVLNYIGRSQYADPLFNGMIDECKIFNYTLSGNEVAALAGNAVLPLSWGDFTARKKNGQSLLHWITHHEINVSSFSIERSNDGNAFSAIGNLQASDSKTLSKSYAFTDAHPAEGVNYYRIKQIDKNGAFAYSKILALTFDATVGMNVSPNPARSNVQITIFNFKQSMQAELVNSAGQKVDSFTIGSRSFQYNVGKQPAGVYYLQVRGNGINMSRKLVIEN